MNDKGDRRHELARTMSALARYLEAEPDEQQTLMNIVRGAVDTVPGVVAGGITQVRRGRISALAPSDDLVWRCDQLQGELREGPCVDAIWEQRTVVVDDLARDGRWPGSAPGPANSGPRA